MKITVWMSSGEPDDTVEFTKMHDVLIKEGALFVLDQSSFSTGMDNLGQLKPNHVSRGVFRDPGKIRAAFARGTWSRYELSEDSDADVPPVL